MKILSFISLLLVCPVAFAAGGTGAQSVNTLVNTFISNLDTVGVGLLTLSIMVSALRMMFTKATFMDCLPWLVGGVVFACAAWIANLMLN